VLVETVPGRIAIESEVKKTSVGGFRVLPKFHGHVGPMIYRVSVTALRPVIYRRTILLPRFFGIPEGSLRVC